MRFIHGVFKLTRLLNLVIIVLCQFLLIANIEDVSYLHLLQDWKFLIIVTSTIMIAAGGNVINDYYDVKIDYINKPDKVVVGKSISRRSSILLHAFLSYGGIIIAFFVSWKLAFADTLIVILLWYYSNRLKCTPLWGNMAVGLLTAMVIVVLPMYTGSFKYEYIVYSYFAFLITIIRELTKDLEDVRGDFTFGCSTYPKVYGIRKSLNLLIILEVVFLISTLAALQVSSDLYLVLYIVVLLILPYVYLLYRTTKSRKESDFKLLSTIDKFIILFGILSTTLL